MKTPLYLVQTDTTVGFLCQDSALLSSVKQRSEAKPFLQVYPDFKSFKEHKHRLPNAFKSQVRRSRRTTFVTKALASRIVSTSPHHRFLKEHGPLYSTSANLSGSTYEPDFAYEHADIIVESSEGFSEKTPSKIYRLGNRKKERLR